MSDKKDKYLLPDYSDTLVLKMSHSVCETTSVAKIKTTFGLSINPSAAIGTLQIHTLLI